MPSTRRQKANARKSREKDILSDCENMDVLLGIEKANPIGRELPNTFIDSKNHNDTKALSRQKKTASRVNQIRDFDDENTNPRHDRLRESREIFLHEINKRFSQDMDLLIYVIHSQNRRTTNHKVCYQ